MHSIYSFTGTVSGLKRAMAPFNAVTAQNSRVYPFWRGVALIVAVYAIVLLAALI